MDKYRLKKSDGNRLEESTAASFPQSGDGSLQKVGECEQSSEVRITQQGKPRNYISYAMSLFVSVYRYVTMRAMVNHC